MSHVATELTPRIVTPISAPPIFEIGLPALPLLSAFHAACPLPVRVIRMAFVFMGFAGLAPLMKLPLIVIRLVASPGVPHTPAGPAVLLPYCEVMPAPPGKFVTVLPEIVALVIFDVLLALPKPSRRIPDPFELALAVELVMVLFEMVAFEIVPEKF